MKLTANCFCIYMQAIISEILVIRYQMSYVGFGN